MEKIEALLKRVRILSFKLKDLQWIRDPYSFAYFTNGSSHSSVQRLISLLNWVHLLSVTLGKMSRSPYRQAERIRQHGRFVNPPSSPPPRFCLAIKQPHRRLYLSFQMTMVLHLTKTTQKASSFSRLGALLYSIGGLMSRPIVYSTPRIGFMVKALPFPLLLPPAKLERRTSWNP
jgi:hypothetical protein